MTAARKKPPRGVEQRTLDRIANREFGGKDDALRQMSHEAAIKPTRERLARITVEILQVAKYRASAHKIVPRVEDLGAQRRISPNMVRAAQYYMMLAYVADGPSIGVGRYGDGENGSPAYGRSLTSDERLIARRVFEAARRAAFGVKDITGREVFDEAARFVLEPILLGDETSRSMTQVGEFLSTYQGENGRSVSGTTEVVAVLRRLRAFFGMGDD